MKVTAPDEPGTYFYGACALPLENESDTRNNCSGSVQLRVWQPNRSPRAVGAIRARPVRAGASVSVDVAPYFDDPDGDTLTYAATSSAPLIATASVGGRAVTVSGALASESDRANNCSDAFAVRVSQENREPRATGVISDRAVILGGSAAFEVSGNFTDPDGDALSYSAVSSDTLTARATALGSTVTVTGVSVGSATITVTAHDPNGLTATQFFAVSVEEETTPLPDLIVESPSVDVTDSIEAGARFTLGARVRNGGQGAAAATTLRYYRSADATITTSDTEVGTDAVSGLGANGSSAETIALDAPSGPGTYHLGACVNAVGNELNVANNCSGAVELRQATRTAP